ncbi:NAC domain-containing protein 21/22 [Brassica napus]|uniref:NAC transcription factor 22 n=1 Tax=Brassica napus TaxID=3708 RepID=A0A0A7BW92_BRANA|nr:NAC domain-containing protein 21/22 [Brassica napus]AHN60137.1 NAC transcription factor 22 [Brassica napus]
MESEEEKESSISMVEAKLPPGFRFHPKDDELVCDYLMARSLGHNTKQPPPLLLIQVDLNKCEPWDIPKAACVGGKDWYFYSQRDRKYATGLRTNRATATGYWKATGKDRAILRKGKLVGMRKTLVFYQGRAPRGRKTDWVMHEFRLQGSFDPPNLNSPEVQEEDWVLCRVFHKKTEGLLSRDNMGSCFDETVSASLPPLMDSYINFDQEPSSYLGDDQHFITSEQVPCFSNLSQNQTLTNSVSEFKTPCKNNPIPLFTSGSAPATLPGIDSFCSSDQMVLRALLSQLTKIDGSIGAKESQSYGEGTSESLLTDIGIPSTAWN